MASVFTKIIEGELPGRFVWEDDLCVGFLSINPMSPGHTLVVPREEVDHWLDIHPDAWRHLSSVAQKVGGGIDKAFDYNRVGTAVVGFEVPHLHVHVWGVNSIGDFDWAKAERSPDDAMMDDAHRRLVGALHDLGHTEAPELD